MESLAHKNPKRQKRQHKWGDGKPRNKNRKSEKPVDGFIKPGRKSKYGDTWEG